jgi:trigger factor
MPDETRTETEEPKTAGSITEPVTEELPEETEEGEEREEKLNQSVELRDVGPCKKHVKVTVDRSSIDTLIDKKFSELVVDTPVAGFRPGKAPRKIIERRFRKDVTQQVRAEVLLKSLEQLDEDTKLSPLAPPNLDPGKIELPEQGPLVYEFDIEVRPEFDLPDYKGLKLRRPVRVFTDADVAEEERRILAPYGSLVPKPEGNADIGDYLIVDMTARDGDRELSRHKEITIRIDPRLALKDGVCENFGEVVKGAQAGDTRTISIKLSDATSDAALRGKTVQAELEIKEVKKLRLPELTDAFLHEFGVRSAEQLRERIRVLLERRVEYYQRQSAREQVLQQLASATSWELPHDLLQRQARKTLHRRLLEMQEAGMSEDEIRGRLRILQQDVLRSTALALKEHFVLQKIAEVENIDVEEQDIDEEIERLAVQRNESPRRVRAWLEKEDLMDVLATELIERAALDLILDNAEYQEVPIGKMEGAVATVEQQAVPGKMHDPTEAPPEAEKEEPAAEEPAAQSKE